MHDVCLILITETINLKNAHMRELKSMTQIYISYLGHYRTHFMHHLQIAVLADLLHSYCHMYDCQSMPYASFWSSSFGNGRTLYHWPHDVYYPALSYIMSSAFGSSS